MKTIRILCALIFGVTLHAQHKVQYVDSLYRMATPEKYVYAQTIRNYNFRQDSYVVLNHDVSGQMASQWTTSNKDDAFARVGKSVKYYPSGKVESETEYESPKRPFRHVEWYPDGKQRLDGEYLATDSDLKLDENLRINSFWSEDGTQTVIDGNGIYELRTGTAEIIGRIKFGLRDSVWTGRENGHRFTERYDYGRLVSGESVAENGMVYVYHAINDYAAPKDGFGEFGNYLAYKLGPIMSEIGGTLTVSFYVEKEGSISDLTIIEPIKNRLQQKIFKNLREYPGWNPQLRRGLPVRKRLYFKLRHDANRSRFE